MRQRNWKYIVVAMIVIFAAILGIRQTHFQTVDSYRQEQRQLAKDVSDSEEDELTSMYETASPQNTEETDQTSSKSNKTSDKKSMAKEETAKNKTKPTGTSEQKKTGKETSGGKASSPKRSSGKASGKSTAHSNKNESRPSNSKKPAQNSNDTAAPSATEASNDSNSGAAGQTPATPGGDNSETPAATGGAQSPSSSPTATPKDEKITCTIEIRCDSLVENKKNVQESIWKYIPSNGQIMEKVSVKVDKNASVYDVLEKACKAKGVALDSEYTPMYKSYYIRGIGNIYEKQAGDMSGWIYKVNGKAPNRGASVFKVSDGDVISWCYTCDGRTT